MSGTVKDINVRWPLYTFLVAAYALVCGGQ